MTKSSFEKKIGIIGLGVLGSAIAKNFIDKKTKKDTYTISATFEIIFLYGRK